MKIAILATALALTLTATVGVNAQSPNANPASSGQAGTFPSGQPVPPGLNFNAANSGGGNSVNAVSSDYNARFNGTSIGPAVSGAVSNAGGNSSNTGLSATTGHHR